MLAQDASNHMLWVSQWQSRLVLTALFPSAADLPTHNKHVYVMDMSGKPIFWRYGSRSQATTKCPIVVSLVDRTQITDDPIQ